jgi:toxin-antitoxin system PIN domain toxin
MKTSEVALLDVSVLIALLDPGHSHHQLAHDWFHDHGDRGWASCPIVENGVVRILGNAARVDDAIPLATLIEMLTAFRRERHHHFWAEDISLCDPDHFHADALRGHQQITDAYLLALAVKNGGRFVTFDQGIPLAAVKGARREHLEVITAAS